MKRGALVRRRSRRRGLRDGPRPPRGRGVHRRRAARPAGSGSAVGARMFRDEVAPGQAEKETELRERLGLVPHGAPRADRGRHRGPATDPARRSRKAATDGHRGDPPPVRRALRGAPATPPCRRPRCCSTTRTCCSSTPAWCRSSPTSSARRPRRTTARSACRSACARPTSRTSARPPGTARSSRCAATSPSATTSRKAPSSSPGTWSPSPQADGGCGLEESRLYPSVYDDDAEAVDALDEGHRPARRADRPARARRRTTGRWACPAPAARARRSSTTAARSTARPTSDARAGHAAELEDRYLEIWNLVFMQDELSAVRSKEDFDIAGSLPKKNIDTGMGLERVAFLLQGSRQHVRDRRDVPGHRAGRGAHRPPLRRRPRGRRPVPGRRRPRPQLDDAHRRRRHARQRGPRLRAAPAAAPRGPLDAAARLRGPRRCPSCCRSAATRWARPTPSCTATGSGSRTVAYAEEDAFRQTLRAGTHDLRPRGRRGEAVRRHDAVAATRRSRCTTPTASRST